MGSCPRPLPYTHACTCCVTRLTSVSEICLIFRWGGLAKISSPLTRSAEDTRGLGGMCGHLQRSGAFARPTKRGHHLWRASAAESCGPSAPTPALKAAQRRLITGRSRPCFGRHGAAEARGARGPLKHSRPFVYPRGTTGRAEIGRGRVESERHGAESQWIVAARPLCHLQYPVAYLSRLQRILPAARWELRFKAAPAAGPSRGIGLRHVPLGPRGSLLLVGNRAAGARVALARILT